MNELVGPLEIVPEEDRPVANKRSFALVVVMLPVAGVVLLVPLLDIAVASWVHPLTPDHSETLTALVPFPPQVTVTEVPPDDAELQHQISVS